MGVGRVPPVTTSCSAPARATTCSAAFTPATDAAPTVGALEARLTKLQRSDLERRLARFRAYDPSLA